jgi:hypothetical protein
VRLPDRCMDAAGIIEGAWSFTRDAGRLSPSAWTNAWATSGDMETAAGGPTRNRDARKRSAVQDRSLLLILDLALASGHRCLARLGSYLGADEIRRLIRSLIYRRPLASGLAELMCGFVSDLDVMSLLALVCSWLAWLAARRKSIERLLWLRDKRERIAEAEARIAEEKAKQEACTTASMALGVYKLAKECGDARLADDLLTSMR